MTQPVEPSRGPRPWLWLLLLLAVLGLVAGVVLWQRFDPFALERPAVKAAKALVDLARQRPLTATEFEQAVALADSGEPLAQLSTIAVLQLEAERDPTRRAAVLEALKKCQQSTNANVATAAGTAAARLQAKGQ